MDLAVASCVDKTCRCSYRSSSPSALAGAASKPLCLSNRRVRLEFELFLLITGDRFRYGRTDISNLIYMICLVLCYSYVPIAWYLVYIRLVLCYSYLPIGSCIYTPGFVLFLRIGILSIYTPGFVLFLLVYIRLVLCYSYLPIGSCIYTPGFVLFLRIGILSIYTPGFVLFLLVYIRLVLCYFYLPIGT